MFGAERRRRHALALHLCVYLQLSLTSHGVTVYQANLGHSTLPVQAISENATVVHLQRNFITQISWFPVCPDLVKLNLYSNRLSVFPDLTNVPSLQELYLSYNNISVIPYEYLDSLTSLKVLDISYNILTLQAIPDTVGPSRTLESLDLAGNQINTIPTWKHLWASVKGLDLENNRITNISSRDFENVGSLSAVKLSGNVLTNLTDLPSFEMVHTLNLARSSLTQFPPVTNRTQLAYLYLTSNYIPCIPQDILVTLKSLKCLLMEYNLLTLPCIPDIPMPFLTKLKLDKNVISVIPNWTYLGQNLIFLTLNYNEISSLSDSDLDPFPKVTYLELKFNNISEFPMLMTNGPRLKNLDLYGNRIRNVSLDHLRPLKDTDRIDVGNNDLHQLPKLCLADFNMTLTLHYRQNTLTCGEEVLWDLAAVASTASFSLDLVDTKCSVPARLQGLDVLTMTPALIYNKALAGWYGLEYSPVTPYFQCFMPITLMQETKSLLECAILCNQASTCILYGYHPHTDTGILNVPGTCAVTAFEGAPVPTDIRFQWFSPM